MDDQLQDRSPGAATAEQWSEQYIRILLRFATSPSAPFILAYLVMVFSSRYLKRLFRPFDLRWLLLLHNLLCSAWSLCCLIGFIVGMWSYGFPRGLFVLETDGGILLRVMWAYWISKLFELLDTVYMLLRHKLRQMSFLHVWHHATITLLADCGYHYYPFPAFTFILALNSFIHVVMYGYYGLTALFPLREFSWKRRITQLQMVQFLLGMIHSVYGYLYSGFCIYSVLYGLGMFTLFGNFYYHSFLKMKKLKKFTEDKVD